MVEKTWVARKDFRFVLEQECHAVPELVKSRERKVSTEVGIHRQQEVVSVETLWRTALSQQLVQFS